MVIHLVRTVYLLVILAFTMSYAFQRDVLAQGTTYVTLYIIVPVIAAFAVVLIDMFWRNKRLQALSGLFFGLVAGLGIAYVLGQIVDLVGNVFTPEVETSITAPVTPGGSAVPSVAPGDRPATPAPAGNTPAAPKAPAAPAAGTKPASAPPNTQTTESDSIRRASAIRPVRHLIKVLLGVSAVFMCISFVLQTKDDFRFIIPYVEFSRDTKGPHPLLLDTSAIIDGRIADIADTVILESEMVVPRFVLAELQTIADSDDKLKRNRGRRGLDVLHRLQNSPKTDIRILESRGQADADTDVDAQLLELARTSQGRIVTTDYNLNKVAQLRGVDVINVNDLANALKPVVLPGEELNVKIVKPGEEAGQGVGYLDDGTMVVAESGREYVGKEIAIVVTSMLQTSAGRMIFGRFQSEKAPPKAPKRT